MAGGVTYQAIRCCRCGLYQVQQVKKTGRFQCVKCRAQQKVEKEFFRGGSKECREIVQHLSKAAHFGEIDFVPAKVDSPQAAASPTRKRRPNSTSDVPPAQTRAELKCADDAEADELFSFDSPKRTDRPEPSSKRGHVGVSPANGANLNSECDVDVSATYSWRRRSLDKLAKFRYSEADDSVELRGEDLDRTSAREAKQADRPNVASPNGKSAEEHKASVNNISNGWISESAVSGRDSVRCQDRGAKDGEPPAFASLPLSRTASSGTSNQNTDSEQSTYSESNIGNCRANLKLSDIDDNDIFDLVETPQAPRIRDKCSQTKTSQPEKPGILSTMSCSDDEDELFSYVVTPLKNANRANTTEKRMSPSKRFPTADSQQRNTKPASDNDNELFADVETPPRISSNGEIVPRTSEASSSDEGENKLGKSLSSGKTATKKFKASGAVKMDCNSSLKTSAGDAIAKEDGVIETANNEECQRNPGNCAKIGGPIRASKAGCDRSGQRLAGDSMRKASADGVTDTYTVASEKGGWRRRSLAKLMKFRYDDDDRDEGDLGKDSGGDTTSRTPGADGQTEDKEYSRRAETQTQPAVVTAKNDCTSFCGDEVRSSPESVSRERLLKTLEKFKMTPSAKRKRF